MGAIALAVVSLLFLGTKESRPSVIMQRQISVIQTKTKCHQLNTNDRDKLPSIWTFATTMLIRPVIFFFTEPIITAVTIMSATTFSSIYLLAEGLPVTYMEFGWTERQASLVFITWILGLILTIPLRMIDWRLVSMRIKQNRTVMPEDKIMGFFVAAPVLAIALWWFAWTVPPYVRLSFDFSRKSGGTDDRYRHLTSLPSFLLSHSFSWERV
jgi:hypothetical protein